MSHNLDGWRDDIAAFNNMLDTRQEAYNERVPKADAVMAATDLDALTQKRVDFESRINEIEKSNDVAALGTPEEQRTWVRLKRIEDFLAQHPDDPDLAEMRDKLRLMKGVMYWRLSESFKARLWNERRSVKELEASLLETQKRAVLVKQARAGSAEQHRRIRRRAWRTCARAWTSCSSASRRCRNSRTGICRLSRSRSCSARSSASRPIEVQARFELAAIYDKAANPPREAEGEAMMRALKGLTLAVALAPAFWGRRHRDRRRGEQAAGHHQGSRGPAGGRQPRAAEGRGQQQDHGQLSALPRLECGRCGAARRGAAPPGRPQPGELANPSASSGNSRPTRACGRPRPFICIPRCSRPTRSTSAMIRCSTSWRAPTSSMRSPTRRWPRSTAWSRPIRTADYIDEAQFRRGELLFSSKSYPAAAGAYEAVIKFGAASAFYNQSLYKHGWSLFKQGETERSLGSFAGVLDSVLVSKGSLEGTDRHRHPEPPQSGIGGGHLSGHVDHLLLRGWPENDRRVREAPAAASLLLPAVRAPGRPVHREGALHGCRRQLPRIRLAETATTRKRRCSRCRPSRRIPRAAFPQLVLQGKKEFVENYSYGTPYWQGRTPKGEPKVVAELKINLKDVAQYYHAQAQRTKNVADYQEAAKWYRSYLDLVPR